MDLNAFHSLVATAYPQLHISVGMSRRTTATATVDRYNIKATGDKLPQEVSTTADSPLAAMELLKPAIAKVRRAAETEKVLAGLQGEWSDIEREDMRHKLLNAHGRAGFDNHARWIAQHDAERYSRATAQAA